MVLLAINETIIPRAALESFAIKESLIDRSDQRHLKSSLSNVTVLTRTNQMIYARRFEIPTRTLHEVIITEDYPDLALKKKTTAQKAVYNDGVWKLYGVRHTEVNPKGEVTNRPFIIKEETLELEEGPEDFIRQETHTEFMKYAELKDYLEKVESTGYRASYRLQVDLYEKLARPLTAFVIVLVGAPAAFIVRRGGLFASGLLALAVIVAYYGVMAVSSALGKGGNLPPLLAAWLPHVIFTFLGIHLLRTEGVRTPPLQTRSEVPS